MKIFKLFFSMFEARLWSFTWRWMLILVSMFGCMYCISTLIGFTWWLLHGQSGVASVIYQTVVMGFMSAALQIFVGMWIYQSGRKKLIEPLLGLHKQGLKDVLGNPIRDMFGNPITYRKYSVPFPWRPITCGRDNGTPSYKGHDQYVLYADSAKPEGVVLLMLAPEQVDAYIRFGNDFIGWCWDFEFNDWLRTHSCVLHDNKK